jgi:hypothetical protein
MTQETPDAPSGNETSDAGKSLPPAARRALEEAKLRREQAGAEAGPAEIGGPKGPEPTRYGDWERNGIVSDF